MTRYQALRAMKCDPFTAGFIAFGNWLRGIQPGRIVFLTVQIDYDADGVSLPDGEVK